jgi:hypothetical protein
VVGIVEGRVVLGMRLIDQLDECTELESIQDIDLVSLIPITLVRMLGILAMTFSRNYNSLHYQCCVTLHPTSLTVPAEKLWGLDQGNAAKVVLRYTVPMWHRVTRSLLIVQRRVRNTQSDLRVPVDGVW